MKGDEPTRRELLAGLAGAGMLGLGGCVTLSPSMSQTFPDSKVFEKITGGEPWAYRRLGVSITLTDRATTALGVSRLVVINESGGKYLETTVSSGQTSVSTYLPLGQTVTIVAVNSSGKTVERVTVRTP